MDSTVSKLVKRAKRGDPEAFGTLIEKYERFVFNIVYRMTGNAEDARDVAQEAFIKAFKKFSYYDESWAFSTWIYRIAINASIDYMRKRGKENSVSLDIFSENGMDAVDAKNIEESVLQKEKSKEIIEAVNALEEEFRTVIVLHDMEGMEYKEISDILGCPMGTVKSRLSRARGKLRRLIEQRKGGAL